MSQTPQTPDTSKSTVVASSNKPQGKDTKRTDSPYAFKVGDKSAPQVVPKGEREAVIVDVKNVGKMSSERHQAHLQIAGEIMELEANVNYCLAAGIEWLEVSEELLKHFSQGQLPECGYHIYKNVRLCLKGTAEEIAKKEQMTCHEVMFPDEGHMKVR